MSARIATLLSFSFLALPHVGQSETTPIPAEPLRANVESIEDHRSSILNSQCQLRLTLLGDDFDEMTRVLDTKLTRAVDDLDRDLIPKNLTSSSRFTFSPLPSLFSGMRGPPHIAVQLKNPSRRANAIKVVEGIVELYSPSGSDGAIVALANPLATEGTPLKHATLEKYGIEIAYITEEKAGEIRRNTSAEDEQRRLAAVAEEVSRRRAERESTMLEAPSADSVLVPGSSTAISIPPSRAIVRTEISTPVARAGEYTRLTFQIGDPKNKLVALEWTDAVGGVTRSMFPVSIGSLRVFTLRQKPTADARLIAYVAAEGTVKSRPFKIENVALP